MSLSRNNNNSLMKRELQLMLAQGSTRIALADNTMRRRSCIWNYYKRVLLDGEDQPFASCNHCDTLVHYSSKHGTGSLLRHKCNTYSVPLYTAADQPSSTTLQQQTAAILDSYQSSGTSSGRNHSVSAETNGRSQSRPKTGANRRGGRTPKAEVARSLPQPATLPVPVSTAAVMTTTAMMTRNYPLMTSSTVATTSGGVDEHMLQRLAEKQVAFMAKDLRPIDTTDGAGFLELAQALMEVAAADSGGPVMPVCDVLVAQPLLAAVYMPRMCERIRVGLVADLLAVERPALSLDVWSNDAGRRFVTLTVTYVTDDFDLRSAVLGTRDLAVADATLATPGGGAERKFQVKSEEGAAVVRAMLDIVSEYTGSVESAAEKLAASALVTDDSNLYAALDDATSTRLLCPCRALNSILDAVLAPGVPAASPAWRQLCRDVDALTEYLRRSGVSEHPLRPLAERPVIASWSDVYETLMLLREAYPQLLSLLAEAGEAGRLRRLPEAVLDAVVDFLDLFKECLESLCVDSYPTINECVLWKLKLEKHCASTSDPARTGLASDEFPGWLHEVQHAVRDKLRHLLNLDKLCSVALLLDPNFKSLRMLSEVDRKWTKEVTMNYMRESIPPSAVSGGEGWGSSAKRDARFWERRCKTDVSLSEGSRQLHQWSAGGRQVSASTSTGGGGGLSVEATVGCIEPPPSKRARSLLNFTEFLQPAGEDEQLTGDPAETELRRYVELRVAGDQLGDVLHFWKTEGADQFPLLRQLAKWVLAIPACSSVKHCPFSNPGRILEQRRRALNSCVDQIVFLHKNLTM